MTESEASQQREQSADAPDKPIQPSVRSDARAQIVEALHASLYTGPIPPPEVLAQYENVLPGLADRIMAESERQRAHRQEAEMTLIRNDARARMAGLIVGMVVALAALALAGVLAALGQSVWAVAIALAEIAALAGVFVLGHLRRREERTTRLEETLNPTVDVSEPPVE